MTATTDKTKALRTELASLRTEIDRHEMALQEAAFDGHDTTELQSKIDAASGRMNQIEGALQAGARRAEMDKRSADQAKVKAARAALVAAGKKAAAQGIVVQKAADELAVALNEFSAALEVPNWVALRLLNDLRGDREHQPTSVNFSLFPVLKSTVQAVMANAAFRVGVKEVAASGFVVDVPAVVNQSLDRLLRAFDDDAQRLPCNRPEGWTAPVVDPDAPPPGQASQRNLRRSQRDPGCFPVEGAQA